MARTIDATVKIYDADDVVAEVHFSDFGEVRISEKSGLMRRQTEVFSIRVTFGSSRS